MADQELHLITGHKGEAHITALNDRHRVRALYSNSNCRLYATHNRSAAGSRQFICTAKTENGTGDNTGLVRLTITKGMVLWNGMLIEIENDVSSDYVESLSNYKVYLHYTRSGASLIETVKILFTTTTMTTTENTGFYDTDSNVYVLFYQYNETLADGWEFPLKDTALNYISALETKVENMFSKTQLYDMFGRGYLTTDNSVRKSLGTASVLVASSATDTSESTVTLSENLMNYMFTEIRIGTNSKDYAYICVPTFQLITSGTGGTRSALGGSASEPSLNWRKLSSGKIYDFFIHFYCDGATAHIGKLKRFIDGEYSAGASTTIYIYGVGKVN